MTHMEFKKAWLKVADLPKEFQKRNLKYDPSPLAQARARERLMRIMTDQEDAYLANLQKINDIVENVKKDRREKKDERKRDRQAAKDAMLHTAAKFQALRNSEKRLMAKIAEEEKPRKEAKSANYDKSYSINKKMPNNERGRDRCEGLRSGEAPYRRD